MIFFGIKFAAVRWVCGEKLVVDDVCEWNIGDQNIMCMRQNIMLCSYGFARVCVYIGG